VIASVPTGAHVETTPFPRRPVRAAVAAPRGGRRRQQRGGGRGREAEQPEPPHRLPAGDDAVREILRDLFGQVLLQLGHRRLPVLGASTRTV